MHNDPFRHFRKACARRGPRDRLCEALFDLAGGQAAILSHHEKSWASITFAGSRHHLELLFEGAEAVGAGELFIALLPDHEFTLPGELLVEAAVTGVDHRLEPPRMKVSIELLTVAQS